MPALRTTVEATTTHEIKLAPAIKRKLLTELKAYEALKLQIKALEHAADKRKATIGKLRDETGEQSLSIDGFTTTLVSGVRESLDKQKLIAQGVTTAQIEAATVLKPIECYEKITLPGAKRGVDDDA